MNISDFIPDLTLPIDDPVLKFLLILIIILAAPLLLNKIKIPPLIGLIIAGAVIGPYGFNLVLRDSSIIMSGTAGLLYIMFLAGLEMDLHDFRKNSWKSVVFGMYTFILPMGFGFTISHYLLGFPVLSSLLLASMIASHTLIAYPIISKLGIQKNVAVTVAVGGTIITDTLALLVLTVIVGMTNGVVDSAFWIKLGCSVLVFALFILLLFPALGRWTLKRLEDNVSQYIFILVLLFSGSYLAHVAGLEPIIGAFLTGMAMNRLIPATSPLMNRISFVGNAIFIPFFLIGVGMLVNYRAFFRDLDTIIVGASMIFAATAAKYCAAWLTQKTFRFSIDQRRLIFGLSNAQAAATLAAVMVGYNIILGVDTDGEPIRLLNEAVLNGTILMILVTCTMASLSAQKGARNIAISDVSTDTASHQENEEKILVSVKREETVSELINLAICMKGKKDKSELYALNVVDSKFEDSKSAKTAQKILHEASVTAAATDDELIDMLRYDVNRTNAIVGVVKEKNITDLILELPEKFNSPDNRFNKSNDGILSQSNITTFIYRPVQPLATIKRHLVIIPEKAEREVGFALWVRKIWRLATNAGARMVFYASSTTQQSLKEIAKKHPIQHKFEELQDLSDFLILAREVRPDDCVWVVLSRREKPSFVSSMSKIPAALQRYFNENSFVLLYPATSDESQDNRYLV